MAPPSLPLPPPLQSIQNTQFFFGFSMELQSIPQAPAICTTQSSLSPFSPPAPPLPLSSVVPPRTCRESCPPGYEEPEPPASVRYALPRPIALAPAPVLLPPSTSAWTISHSVSPDSLGTLASPGSDIASHLLRTCGPSAALWSSTSSAAACSILPQAPPPPSREVVTAALSRPPGPSPPWLIGCAVASILAVSSHSPHQHSSMAPPSINAAVEHSAGCVLDGNPSAPAQGHPLAHSTFITTLDFVVCPPPGHPSTPRTFICLSVPSLHHPLILFTGQGHAYWEGAFCHIHVSLDSPCFVITCLRYSFVVMDTNYIQVCVAICSPFCWIFKE
ncbi:hypothetical protein PO909_026877 [Leuciscus waleckii]